MLHAQGTSMSKELWSEKLQGRAHIGNRKKQCGHIVTQAVRNLVTPSQGDAGYVDWIRNYSVIVSVISVAERRIGRCVVKANTSAEPGKMPCPVP